MKTVIKKGYCVIMMFIASFIMLLMFPKTVNAATFENTVYYDTAQAALQQASGENELLMDADLNKIALQLAVDITSGEGYDFEVGLPRREDSLRKKTNYYKSWMREQCGFFQKSDGIEKAQNSIASGITFSKNHYSDYNLIGIALIENENTRKNGNYSYCIVLGKGTCKPETKTGIQTETITSGASLSFTDDSTSGSSTPVASNVKVSKVEISGPAKTLLTGKKMTLKAVITPSNASNQKVTWSVSNKKYASVNAQGVVTAKTAGAGKTITVTAKTTDGTGIKATYKIKIKGAVKKISLKAAKSVKAGKKVTVKATVSVGKGWCGIKKVDILFSRIS